MIISFTNAQLAEYGVNNMLSGDLIYVTDTEEIYFKTNNIDGGDPKVYRASIHGSPVEVVTPKITFDCDYIYSGITREATISLDVENVTDKTKLKNMKLAYGSNTIDIASVPCTKTISIDAETKFTFSGVYDQTSFTGNKTISEVCPVYIGVVDKAIATAEEVKTAIIDSSHLINSSAPLSTIKGYAKDFILTEGQRIAFICGDNHATIQNTKALGNDYLLVNGVTTTLGSKTGYVYLTSPLMAQSVRESFNVQ